MNSWFFGILCTFLGAAIGGAITISTPQAQRTITNSLFAATGGVAAAWAGYGLGRWQTKREQRENSYSAGSQRQQFAPETSHLPKFRIAYPHTEVKYKDTVGGSFDNLSDNYEPGVWLYILGDDSVYMPHKVRYMDRVKQQWKIEDIPFGLPDPQDDGKNYDIQLIWANQDAISELLAGQSQGLRKLPVDIKYISEKVTVKRKVFF